MVFGFDRMGVLAHDKIGDHHPLVAGLMRKPRRAGDVAYGVKAVDGGACRTHR